MDKEKVAAALQHALTENNYTDLETLAKYAVSSFPGEAFGYYYLGETLLLALPPRFAEAEICLAKALEITPKNLAYLTRFAELKEKQGNHEDAQIIWGKILRADSKHAQALAAKGTFQILEYQDYQQGLELMDKAIEAAAENLPYYYCRAEAHYGLKQYEAALADLDKGLGGNFNEGALVLKIATLVELGRSSETLPIYETLIKQSVDDPSHHFNYGQALMEQQEFEKAIDHLQTTIELLEEKHSMYFRTLGQAALYAMQFDKAAIAFGKAIHLDPEDSETHLMLIETKIQQQKYTEALKSLEQLLQNETEDKSIKDRCHLLKGNTYLAMKNLEAAEEIFLPIAKTKSLYQKEAYYGLGLCYQQQNDSHKAYKFMKAAKAANHPLAQEYINAYLQEFLAEAKKRSLQANEKEFENNASSLLLQQLFGKLWKFENLDSKKLNAFPKEYASKIKASMSLFSLVISPKGALLLSKNQKELLTYRIKEATATGLSVEFLPLDYFPAFLATLQLTEKGLIFSKEADEQMLLQQQNLDTIPKPLLTNFKNHLQQQEVAYFGTATEAIWEHLL